jgi:hypothetical protein
LALLARFELLIGPLALNSLFLFLLRTEYYALSNLLSKTYVNAPRYWILELEILKLDLEMMLAVEMPDYLVVVVEVALAWLASLRIVKSVLV